VAAGCDAGWAVGRDAGWVAPDVAEGGASGDRPKAQYTATARATLSSAAIAGRDFAGKDSVDVDFIGMTGIVPREKGTVPGAKKNRPPWRGGHRGRLRSELGSDADHAS
jgi:hypothetical protein